MQAGKFVAASEIRDASADGLFPCYGGNGLRGYTSTYTHSGKYPLIGRQGALCGNVTLGLGEFHATEHAVVATPKKGFSIGWLYFLLGLLNLNRYATGQAQPGLSVDVLSKVQIAFPKKEAEQHKIADCLNSADALIAVQGRKLETLRAHKKGLMQQLFPQEGETRPRLRFPEFWDAGDWEESTVGEIITTISPPKKLQTSDYEADGEFPIVDQSQAEICGWTNDGDAVIDNGLPVIVFGDHTCALKFVDRPFVQGADGIKIIRPKRGIDVRFLFSALEANPVKQESYKRHFSMLKEKKLPFPDTKSTEQQRIADCLTSVDGLIAVENRKLDTLKSHKKGLMQQLFPSIGEADV